MRWFRRGTSAPLEERDGEIDLTQMLRLRADAWLPYSPAPVTVSGALTMAASSACVDLLASSVSTLPLDVVLNQGGRRIPVAAPPLIASPSNLVEPDVWLYQVVESMCTDGNAFGDIAGLDEMGRPTGIELIAPACVTDRRVVAGVPQAMVNGVRRQLYPWGDLWHVPGKLIRAGQVFADSPVARAAATIGTALAAREFGGRFFGDGGHPNGLLTLTRDPGPDQIRDLKRRFVTATQGSREPIMLPAGSKWEQLSINPQDSQFLDLMRWVTEEACRFWRVPPTMIYAATSGQSVTYANASQADLGYLKHSLDSYLTRIERALGKLIAGPLTVRFNRSALLRTDDQTRNAIYDQRLRNKTMTINEVRALEDEPPFPGAEFDQPGVGGGAAREDLPIALQRLYLAVGKMITAEEAREIANSLGADLPIPGPDFATDEGATP